MIVDLDDPLKPQLAATVPLEGARASRAAVPLSLRHRRRRARRRSTSPTRASRGRVDGARVPLADARRRLRRAHLRLRRRRQATASRSSTSSARRRRSSITTFTADGKLNDARDVVVGSTNASLFAYVADGAQRPEGDAAHLARDAAASFYGFIARAEAAADRLARDRARRRWRCRKGLDRDRAVDETGDQIAVFGRIGSRPFTLEEMRRFYLQP